MITIDAFIAKYNGKLINNGGTECVALANQYEADVVGGGFISANWASDWWNYFSDDAVEKVEYVQVGANAAAQKGDLAVWSKYPTSAEPHIALVEADLGTGGLSCFTQNPLAAHTETLVKTGLLGYLRPKLFVVAAPATAAQPAAPTNGVIAWSGTVKLTSAANVRSVPTTQGNNPLHVDAAGTICSIIGYVKGESVTQNGVTSDVWLDAWNHTYIWCKNTNWAGPINL